MNRQLMWRCLLAVLVIAGSVALVLTRPVRLGLDLRGGSQIVLEARDHERQVADDAAVSQTLEVLRRRVDQLGVAEPSLQRSGDRRIIVELPGVADPEQAVEVIGRTAQLEFHPVLGFGPPPADPSQEQPPGEEPAEGEQPGEEPAEGEQPGEEPAGDVPVTDESPAAAVFPLAQAPVDETPTEETTDEAPAGEGTEVPTEEVPTEEPVVLVDEFGRSLLLGPSQVSGGAVRGASAVIDPNGAWTVNIDFQRVGSDQWQALTGAAACAPPGDPQRLVAIVLDTEIISAPQVNEDILCNEGIGGGTTIITGSFDEMEAKELALLIRAGALPVPVEIVEQRTVGPTLGQAAIDASTRAALIGAALTILYMIFYYRVIGLVAAISLLLYGIISFAVLLALNATLTLPGIAGFVLAIGMAVDANVLVFERMREEYTLKNRVLPSVGLGFKKALSAIADSNITTLLAAVLLFFLASGAVRGFGVTLSVGVVVSIFTALVITRALVELIVKIKALRNRPALLGIAAKRRLMAWLDARRPDIIGRRKKFFIISLAAVAVCLAGLGVRNLNYGIEFTGGRLLEFSTEREVPVDALRAELSDQGLAPGPVQSTGEGNVSIRTGQLTAEEKDSVEAAVAELGGETDLVRDEFVGPSIGNELRQKALIALGLALLAQLAYLAVRFRWNFGLGAVAAMFHDVLILIGIFAWLGKEIDGVFLAALLTVIGYSVNDSVVVFDRIREKRRERFAEDLEVVANEACLQTIPRTVNTGLGALFILVALFALGGDSLQDFALALIIGIVVGTYSSVFLAAPLCVVLDRWKPAPPPARKPQAGRRGPSSSSRSRSSAASRRTSSSRPRR